MFDLEVTIDFTNGYQFQFEFGEYSDGEVTLINNEDEVIISSNVNKYWDASTFENNGWEIYPFEIEKVRINGSSYPRARKIVVLNTAIKHSFPHVWERIIREVCDFIRIDVDGILTTTTEDEVVTTIKSELDKKYNKDFAKRNPYRVIFLNGATQVTDDVTQIPNNCRETNEKDDYGRTLYREVNKEADKWEKDYDTCVWLLQIWRKETMVMVIKSKTCSYPVKNHNVSYLPELARLLKQRGVTLYASSYLLDIMSDVPNELIIELAEYDCGYQIYPYIPSSDEINKMVEIIDRHLS